MATRMQQRRDTAANWTLSDPILAPGEIGFETDSSSFKVGDGSSTWSELSYFVNLAGLGGSLDDYVPLTQKASVNGIATLDSTGNIPSSQLAAAQTIAETAAAAAEAAAILEAQSLAATAESNAVSQAETIAATAASSAVSNVIAAAPAALDTLNELAAALGDDQNFAATVTTTIAEKAPLESPTFSGTVDFTQATVLGVATEAPQIIHPFALGA